MERHRPFRHTTLMDLFSAPLLYLETIKLRGHYITPESGSFQTRERLRVKCPVKLCYLAGIREESPLGAVSTHSPHSGLYTPSHTVNSSSHAILNNRVAF